MTTNRSHGWMKRRLMCASALPLFVLTACADGVGERSGLRRNPPPVLTVPGISPTSAPAATAPGVCQSAVLRFYSVLP